MSGRQDVYLALAPEQFYWALLDVQSLPRSRRRDLTALGYLFESVLPVSIEHVHAAYASAAGAGAAGGLPSKLVACGMARSDLAALVGAHSASLTLNPQRPPGFISEAGAKVDVRQLNLLTGDLEPAPLRRGKRRLMVQASIVVLLITISIVGGLARRTNAIHEQIAAIESRRHDIIASTVGSASSSPQPPELRMLSELRLLAQTRGRGRGRGGAAAGAAAKGVSSADVLATFGDLVANWPRDLQIRAESVLITPTTMTLRGLAPASADVQALADALTNLRGWRLEQPQISATGAGAVQATLQWKCDLPPSTVPSSEASR